jgi:polyisoprenoid-binding protein YceI
MKQRPAFLLLRNPFSRMVRISKSTIKQATLVMLLAVLPPTLTYAQSWTISSANTSFTVKMFGVGVEGTFKGFHGKVDFDPDHLAQSSISGSVDATTLDTDNALRDRHLKEKEDFFQVARYPRVSMQSTKIEKSGSGYVGTFTLQLKSVTKSVRIPFTFQENGSTAVLAGSVRIDRTDWQFGGNTLGMSDEVKLDLKLNLRK